MNNSAEGSDVLLKKPIGMNAVERFWCHLGGSTPLLFGRESASAMVWMLVALSARFMIVLFKLSRAVPIGLLFASPYVLQVLLEKFDFMNEAHPLLSVRLAESVLGRVQSLKMAIIIPAHFLGCLLGAAIFYSLCPVNYQEVFEPLHVEAELTFSWFVLEIVFTSLYIVAVLVLPGILALNKMKRFWIGLLTLPLLLIPGLCYHPAAEYALWYIRNRGYSNIAILQYIIGTIVGAACGGVVMSYYFPDDPKAWIRK